MTSTSTVPSDSPVAAPVCEAVACGRALTPAQLARGARACSASCRARAHREGRKARRLAEIDQALRVLLDLRAEIERG
jgi:hypothetical protein